MPSRPLRRLSALFIDYENLPLSPDALPNWLAWLEDGRFDHGRRRRFAVKRVYWNSAAEKHRDKYEAQGFDVVLCEKFANRKNGADIRMAVDIVETVHTRSRIDEFVLVTVDSDFVPVLQRLQARGKRSVVLVDEERPDHHTICRRHADVLIPVRKLVEARQYQRPPSVMSRLAARMPWLGIAASPLVRPAAAPAARPTLASFFATPARGVSPAPVSPLAGPAGRLPTVRPQGEVAGDLLRPLPRRTPAVAPGVIGDATPPSAAAEDSLALPAPAAVASAAVPGVLDTAATAGDDRPAALPPIVVERVLEVIARRPGEFTGKAKVVGALKRLPGFQANGRDRFFGFTGYRALMLEIARVDPRVRVVGTDGGGIGIIYDPDGIDRPWEQAVEPHAIGEPPPGDGAQAERAPAAVTPEAGEAGDAKAAQRRAADSQPSPPALRIVSSDR